MQTILGSNGVIGQNIAKNLFDLTDRIRLVGRNPRQVNNSDQLFKADLRDAKQTMEAVAGSEIVYLTAGLTYSAEVWQKEWPLVMENVINACKVHQARLVFFDNVYAYGKVNGWMKEDTPFNPCSRKGEVRAEIATRLLNEMKAGNIEALIARSADFYGPNTPNCLATILVFERLAKGKDAQWVLNDHTKHSLTYTPDAAKACVMLGNNRFAYGSTWHLPTHEEVLSGKEFIEIASTAFAHGNNHQVLHRWMMQMAGWFDQNVKESMEMLYQMEQDYLFDSSRFNSAFQFEPTSYKMGIVESMKFYQKS